MAPRLNCTHCGGEGILYASRHGGNDPDVWPTGECPSCNGTANQPCTAHGCTDDAVKFNGDGEAVCEGCSLQWKADNSQFGVGA